MEYIDKERLKASDIKHIDTGLYFDKRNSRLIIYDLLYIKKPIEHWLEVYKKAKHKYKRRKLFGQ